MTRGFTETCPKCGNRAIPDHRATLSKRWITSLFQFLHLQECINPTAQAHGELRWHLRRGVFFFFFFFLAALRIEPMVSCLVGKHSTTEPPPAPHWQTFSILLLRHTHSLTIANTI